MSDGEPIAVDLEVGGFAARAGTRSITHETHENRPLAGTERTHYAGNSKIFSAPATMAHWASEGYMSAIEAFAHSCQKEN